MQPFTVLKSCAVPLDLANVDTDALMPKQFMKTIKRTGLGDYLFDAWRHADPGYPGKPAHERTPNPDFPLNRPEYAGAQILLGRENFGCGSSREHACWALADYGIRAVIAPSFADIFHNNCFKNGLLPIVLEAQHIDELFASLRKQPRQHWEIDLPAQLVRTQDGRSFAFEIDEYRKHCLIEALDDVSITLQSAGEIREYEARRKASEPWLFKGDRCREPGRVVE